METEGEVIINGPYDFRDGAGKEPTLGVKYRDCPDVAILFKLPDPETSPRQRQCLEGLELGSRVDIKLSTRKAPGRITTWYQHAVGPCSTRSLDRIMRTTGQGRCEWME